MITKPYDYSKLQQNLAYSTVRNCEVQLPKITVIPNVLVKSVGDVRDVPVKKMACSVVINSL